MRPADYSAYWLDGFAASLTRRLVFLVPFHALSYNFPCYGFSFHQRE